MTNKEVWKIVLDEIELNTSRANFTTWFKNTSLISRKNKTAIINVPNSFTKEWLQNKYTLFILKILKITTPEIKNIEYVIQATLPQKYEGRTVPEPLVKNSGRHEFVQQLRLEVPHINGETNLNPKYAFSSFVVGSSNELAHAASWSVAKNSGTIYNPLFIYGGAGLGKTHLLQAIGNEIANAPVKKIVRYLPSEKFTMELVAAIRDRKVEEFKDRYRKVDVLIIDDIQFLAGKEKTQEEFFHTFNALYEKNKQIVLSSDRPPKSIATLEERLRSRFEGGMIADIGYPDFETRVAILKTKGKERNLVLSEEVYEFIATHIQTNIRELEGALNRIIASLKLQTGDSSGLATVKTLLAPIITKNKKNINWKKIIQVVSEFYDVSEKDILSPRRKKEFVLPRQIVMYLLRQETKASYPFIGMKLGGRDHTTVMYACEKITACLENNDALSEEITMIKERVYSV